MVRNGNATLTGVLCGAGAGALWGLVFLAPELARAFDPLQLTVGRYLAYGLIALLLVAPRWKALVSRLDRQEWVALGWLALAGNTLYYILLSGAVQMGGIAMTSLVVGFLPLAVTIIGSRERGAVPLARLAPSLLLCAAGALCIGWQAVEALAAAATLAPLLGLLCALGALASWTAYAVSNARWLARLGDMPSHDWNLLLGLVTGAQSLVLLPLALWLGDWTQTAADWRMFAGVSLGVALFASIAGNALWNRASRLLPLTLVGQMILFETLFALLYAFAWEGRGPTLPEAVAFVFVVASVLSCIAAHRRPATETGAVPAPACPPQA